MYSSNDYRRIKQIGKGAFGAAILVECKNDRFKKVVKIIKHNEMNARQRSDAKKEIELLSKFKHQNIVKYFNSFEESGAFHIVMEYCDGGDLHSKIKSQRELFKEDIVLNYFSQICLAIKYIHDQKILHRDIKPQNIFLMRNDIVKLGDFGIAKLMNSTTALAKSFVGTPFYLSPEICEGRPYNNKSDIWALGCVLYEICALRNAFNANEMHILTMKIRKLSYNPIPTNYSLPVRNLIENILRRVPSTRPDINGILTKPFLVKVARKYDSSLFPAPVITKAVTPRPPSAMASPVVKKPVPKRPSTADVQSKVDSGLGVVKRAKPNISKMNNSPYAPAAVRVKKNAREDQKRYIEHMKNIRMNLIKRDSDEAWQKILNSPPASQEEPAKNIKPAFKSPSTQPKTPGEYDKYHEQLRKLEDDIACRKKEIDTLDQMIKMNNGIGKNNKNNNNNNNNVFPFPQNHIRHNPDDPVIISPNQNIKKPIGNDYIVSDFLERKYKALQYKNNDGGVAAALGGYHKNSASNSPRVQQMEIADRLQQIRRQNSDKKNAMNIDNFQSPFVVDNKKDPLQLHDTKILQDLQNAARQKADELRLKLEKHRENYKQQQQQEKQNQTPTKKQPPVTKPDKKTDIIPPPKMDPANVETISDIISQLYTPREPEPSNKDDESQSDMTTYCTPSSRPSTAQSSQQQSKKSIILSQLNAKMKEFKQGEAPKTGSGQQNEDNSVMKNRRGWSNEMAVVLKSSDTMTSTMDTICDASEIGHDDKKMGKVPSNQNQEETKTSIDITSNENKTRRSWSIPKVLDDSNIVLKVDPSAAVDTLVIESNDQNNEDDDISTTFTLPTEDSTNVSTDLSATITLQPTSKNQPALTTIKEQSTTNTGTSNTINNDQQEQIEKTVLIHTDPKVVGQAKVLAWASEIKCNESKENTEQDSKTEKQNLEVNKSVELKDSEHFQSSEKEEKEEDISMNVTVMKKQDSELDVIVIEDNDKSKEEAENESKQPINDKDQNSEEETTNLDDKWAVKVMSDPQDEEIERLNKEYLEVMLKLEELEDEESYTARSNEDITVLEDIFCIKSDSKPFNIRRVASDTNLLQQRRKALSSFSSSSSEKDSTTNTPEPDNNDKEENSDGKCDEGSGVDDYFEDADDEDKSNLLMANIEEIRDGLEKKIGMDKLIDIMDWIESNNFADDFSNEDDENGDNVEEKESVGWLDELSQKLDGKAELVNEIFKLVLLEKQMKF